MPDLVAVTSVEYWLFIGIVAAVRRQRWAGLAPEWLFLIATLAGFALGSSRRASALLFACALLSTVSVLLIARRPSTPRLIALWVSQSAVFLASFGWSDWTPRFANLALFGLPYLYLRTVALGTDIFRGVVTNPGVIQTLAYLLPLHQIVAGPIERYAGHRQRIATVAPLSSELMLVALSRITDGLVKKLILCELLVHVFVFDFAGDGVWLAVEIAAHAWYFYLDFSGYMDLAIGVGILLGWSVPENFSWPFLSRNIIEFWTRWHITLGEFLRDYIFNPSNVALQRGLLRGRPLAAGIISYSIAMLYCGLWHHPSVQFLCWGGLHAAAISACKLYDVAAIRLLGRSRMKTYMDNRVLCAAATAATFAFVAASFLLVVRTPLESIAILKRLY